MTEREYVEHLWQRADDYITAIGGTLTIEPVENWEGAKVALRAHTFRDMCDAWLARDDATRFKSEAFAAVHESARDLHSVGAISDEQMREYDETCLKPKDVTP